MPFGASEAQQLVDYHRQRSGIGREKKFHHFFSEILRRQQDYSSDYAVLMERYSRYAKEAVFECEVAPGLKELMEMLENQGVVSLVVSGTEHQELKEILVHKGLSSCFADSFGSPRSKTDWIDHISANWGPPQVCIGDSRYDFEAAMYAGAQFVFASNWTEFDGWQDFFSKKPEVLVVDDLSHLHESMKKDMALFSPGEKCERLA